MEDSSEIDSIVRRVEAEIQRNAAVLEQCREETTEDADLQVDVDAEELFSG